MSQPNDQIKVQNRFTFSNNVELEGLKIVDFYCQRNYKAYILKNETHYYLKSARPAGGFDTVPLRGLNTVVRVPHILAGSRVDDGKSYSAKFSVWFTNDEFSQEINVYTFNGTAVSELQDTFFSVKSRDDEARGAEVGADLLLASFDRSNHSLRLFGSFRNDALEKYFAKGDKFEAANEFAIAGSDNYLLIVMQDVDLKVRVGVADARTATSVFYTADVKDFAGLGLFSSMACRAGVSDSEFMCVFAGNGVNSYRVTMEGNRMPKIELYTAHKRYKNMDISQLLISPKSDFFIAAGTRLCSPKDSNASDTAGLMYYALDGKSMYFAGGMDRVSLQRQAILTSDKLMICPQGNLVISRGDQFSRSFSLSTPSVTGSSSNLHRL